MPMGIFPAKAKNRRSVRFATMVALAAKAMNRPSARFGPIGPFAAKARKPPLRRSLAGSFYAVYGRLRNERGAFHAARARRRPMPAGRQTSAGIDGDGDLAGSRARNPARRATFRPHQMNAAAGAPAGRGSCRCRAPSRG
jgi:hypothetical protein